MIQERMMTPSERITAALTIAMQKHLTCRELLECLEMTDWIMERWTVLSDIVITFFGWCC